MFKTQTRTLTIDEQGISTVIGTKSAVRTWVQIRSVADEEEAVVITGNNENSFIIPARAFESEAARTEFFVCAKKHFKDACASGTLV
jgi:hypothetical protein